MPDPRTPYEAVLSAARDVAKLDCAFDAELLGSALLGSVYSVAEGDREATVRAFVGGFLTETASRRTASAYGIRRVFAALVPDAPGASETGAGAGSGAATAVPANGTVTAAPANRTVTATPAAAGGDESALPTAPLPPANGTAPGEPAASTAGPAASTDGRAASSAPAEAATAEGLPRWVGDLGRVRLTGSYAYGDVYGDQTSYVATFAYEDTVTGGPEHAVVALIDHNIGIAKDIFVGGPADVIVDQIRELCGADEETWLDEKAEPGRLRDEIGRYLKITDSLHDLPGEGSIATDRALAGARLALLPRGGTAEPEPLDAAGRAALTADFLASPEAADLAPSGAAGRQSLDFSIRLLLDHADTFPDADPLRWSPVMTELFLLDWVHRTAVLDDADATMLPRVLRAWVAYAGRVRGLPAAVTGRTLAAVDELAPEFARLHASGERTSPAAKAVAELMADGVDPEDTEAVAAWLRARDEPTA